jgi:hypothetical protein
VLVVGSAMKERLQTALGLDSGGGRVDPAEGDEGDGGECPRESESCGDSEEDVS